MATIPQQKIKPSSALANLAKRFAPVEVQPDETSKDIPKTDIFSEMALDRNIELDEGDLRTYDVFPDCRPIMATIAHEINTTYADLNIKGHPILTPMSYLGYCMALTYSLALLVDCNARRVKSFAAQFWMDDRDRKDFYKRIQHLRIPQHLADILLGLAPVYDPRRPGHEFVFTAAAFLHRIDFGRTFPVNMFFQAHHLLASTRSNQDPEQLLFTWLNKTVYTMGNVAVKVGNLIGTGIRNNADDAAYRNENFVNSFLETVFNGVTARFHSSRPTFKKTPLSVPTHNNAAGNFINGYDFLFGITHDESPIQLLEYLEAVSRFIESDSPKSATLGLFLGSLSSISIMSHVISPPVLPTFHMLTIASKITDGSQVDDLTPLTFSQKIHFLDGPDSPDRQLTIPYKETSDDKKETYFLSQLYMATNKKLTASTSDNRANYLANLKKDNAHDQYLIFDIKQHVTPRVRIFDPYDYNPSKMAYPITCGLWIEHAEIDSFCVPLPHEKSSLHEENSFALQAGITADKIFNFSLATEFQAIARPPRSGISQPISFSLYDMTKNRLPSFFLNAFNSTAGYFGFNQANNVHEMSLGSNRWSHDAEEASTVPAGYIYLWSPYRVIMKARKPAEKDIFVMASFRGIYGTNVTLAETRHPFALIPH